MLVYQRVIVELWTLESFHSNPMFKGTKSRYLRTTLSQLSVISHCKRRLQGIPFMRAYVSCSALNFKDIFILALKKTGQTDTFRVRSTVMFQALVSRIEQSVPALSPASILRVFHSFNSKHFKKTFLRNPHLQFQKRNDRPIYHVLRKTLRKLQLAPTVSPCHVGKP